MRRRRNNWSVWVAVGLVVILVYAIAAKTGGVTAVSASKVKYKEYSYQDVPITVSLPVTTNVTEDYYSGGEMLLNSYLCDEKLNYHGYIQIWNIEDPEGFIEKSKLNSTFRFTSFEHKKVTEPCDGFAVSWTAQLQDSGDIAGKDYILKKKGKDDQFLRISLTVNETAFPEKLVKIEENIISSLEWK